MAPPALAVTTTWVGPSGNWNVPGNWDNGVPLAGYDANLTSTTSKTATLDTTTPLLNSVIVDGTGGATFTLNQTYYPLGNLSASAETIGLNGIGVYNHNAGNNIVGSVAAANPLPAGTIDRTLVLGFNAGSKGTYKKTGGSLSTAAMVVGRGGTGIFTLSSGKASVGSYQPDGTEPFSVIIGGLHNSGVPIDTGVGQVTLSSSTFNVDGGEVVGQEGQGTLTASSSTHTVGGYFIVGNWDGSVGEAKFSSSTFKVGGNEHIGDTGTGKMTLSSTTHEVGGDLFVGKFTGSMGDIISSSSSILVKGNAVVGGLGPGTFNASSSSITVNGNYTLGQNASGMQTISSSTLKVLGDEVIGDNGPATFNMSSSTNSANTITVAANAPATYQMSSSTMTATDPGAPATAIWIKGPYDGNIPSATGGNLLISGTSTVNGNVTNDGLIKTTNATVTWNGVVTNNSAYVSDPSTQTFNFDLVNSTTGYLVATHSQDLFLVRGDFISTSTQNTMWDTLAARLRFAKGGVGNDTIHEFDITGVDNGAPGNVNISTLTDNFNWRLLNINNQTINLKDGNAAAGGALYVGVLNGADVSFGPNVVNNIFGDLSSVLNIYYDPDLTANAYLKFGGIPQTFDFANGPGHGQLIPFHTPIPPSALLLGSGLLGMGLLGWRRKRLKG
jgi:hypothetical protein